MIQLPFPSTIKAQPCNVTSLTIKTVVRKIQKDVDQTGSIAWTRQWLDKRASMVRLQCPHQPPAAPAPQLSSSSIHRGASSAFSFTGMFSLLPPLMVGAATFRTLYEMRDPSHSIHLQGRYRPAAFLGVGGSGSVKKPSWFGM